jgi:RHH-type proline utilization regulon transcriptional repressor/proline dehydrogenase/delta 1-pyrroline-5-carboxylate dehydrogenase
VTELPPYAPEPVRRWHDPAVRAAFATAVEHQAVAAHDLEVPAVIGGRRIATEHTLTSVDPGRTDRVVAVSARVDAHLADEAVAVAVAAAPSWAATPAGERAGVLLRAAAWLRERRDEVAARQVFEAGKPWAEADADVCEAIDFCEYYAREARRLDHGGTVQSPPGERNRLTYRARGVAAVIAPWNFPLAIPTGMVTAALAASTVCFKPAEQTRPSPNASCALEAGGRGGRALLPPGGRGGRRPPGRAPRRLGHRLHRLSSVGLSIVRTAAAVGVGQRQIKRAITEPAARTRSSSTPTPTRTRRCRASPPARSLRRPGVGRRASSSTALSTSRSSSGWCAHRAHGAGAPGPRGHHRPGDRCGCPRALLQTQRRAGPVPGPLVADEVPGWLVRRADDRRRGAHVRPLATDEHRPRPRRGPGRLDRRRFAMANATDYALTAGLYSRSPVTIARAGQARAGNIYLNRGTTGAVVGRQPFGGFGCRASAPRPAARLPRQFCDPVVVTENTLRQGFAADHSA